MSLILSSLAGETTVHLTTGGHLGTHLLNNFDFGAGASFVRQVEQALQSGDGNPDS